MKLIDALGQEHQPVHADIGAPRIVSLVPSLTELLCDLGLHGWLVGRTGFCIHPKAVVQTIPKVGGTKDVDIEKVRQLAPTHLIVNIDENEKPVVDELARFVPHIVVTHPQYPRDNLSLYRLFGGIFCAEQHAENLCAAFESAYSALKQQANSKPKKVLYCIWKDPWMTVSRDTYIASMLGEINWHQWVAPQQTSDQQKRYPVFEWSAQLLDAIDCILLSTEPYRFADKHVDALREQTGKPVHLIDGEMVSWYGSRAIHGLRYLQQLAEQAG